LPTTLDACYALLFALAFPLLDYWVILPAFRRQVQVDPARARLRIWMLTCGYNLALLALGLVLWSSKQRAWMDLGFRQPEGWRFWAGLGLVLLLGSYLALSSASVARNAEAKASVRRQLSGDLAAVLPRTGGELGWFSAVALTVGVGEEFLFRGFLVWCLSPWLGWWGAAALSLAVFALCHLYQGWTGVLRTGLVGGLFTLVVALLGSLWPAIALHVLLDLGQGAVARLALREAGVSGVLLARDPIRRREGAGDPKGPRGPSL
jgi:membrane protease YdiL (CAAX protease family)